MLQFICLIYIHAYLIMKMKCVGYSFLVNCRMISNAFTNVAKVAKSYTPAAHVPDQVIVPKKKFMKSGAKELYVTHQKHGRPIGSKFMFREKEK